jgi:2-methylcitrate dehydratase PrpD
VAANTVAGVEAARLAASGIVGAASALSGSSGFVAVYGGVGAHADALVEGLGEEWRSGEFVAKPYPTAGWNVGPIYAISQLLAEEPVRPEAVESVHVLHTWWRRNTAYVYPGPFTTVEQALVSCNFAVACTIRFGGYDWDAVKAGLADPQVADLASRVDVEGVATWGFTDGAVTLKLTDGSTQSATAERIPEHLVRPTWADVVRKFDALVPFEDDRVRRELFDAIASLEVDAGLARFTAALQRAGAAVRR